MEEEEELTSILPGEIMHKILSLLPVKTLVKLSCVKKSWYNLFKDPWFVKLHYNHSSRVGTDGFIVIGNKHYRFWKTQSEFLKIHQGSSKPEKLGVTEPGKVSIVGSSNGLVCLTYSDNKRFGVEFKVMNPALRVFRYVYKSSGQISSFFADRASSCVVGFGFDEKNGDFKILRVERIKQPRPNQRIIEVYLYSLHSDSWKTIQSSWNVCLRLSHLCMVTLGSSLYCLSSRKNNNDNTFITRFDLSSETFHTVPPPESRNLDCKQILAWKNESLALILLNREKNDYELWTVDSPNDKIKNINKDSWKMKTAFSLNGLPDSMFASWQGKDGDFPIFCGHKESVSLLYLKMKKNAAENPELAKFIRSCRRICYYRESLQQMGTLRNKEKNWCFI